ncbi:MAG: M60 family metallopeptidase [Bacteroidales bacterium]|nr:M60 family metallopeptidase [Bacteroidales bacterium]
MNYSPVKKTFKIEGSANVVMDFPISEKAEYKVNLKFLEGEGLRAPNPYIEIRKGKAYKINPVETAHIQLNYISDNDQKTDYEWIYGEVTVPEEYDANNSIYGVLGYKNVRLGMNRNTKDNSMVIFAVSEGLSANDGTELINKGDKVHVEENTNLEKEEKTHISYYDYKWDADSTLCYLIHRKKLPDDKALLSAWFKNKTDSDWNYLATWKATVESPTNNIYSYVRSQFAKVGYSLRKPEFYNIWYKPVQGSWEQISKAQLSVVEKNRRKDYSAGIIKDNGVSQKFYLATGGFKSSLLPQNDLLEIQKTNIPPDIHITVLEKFVDEIVKAKNSSSWSYIPDTKIEVTSATASNSQWGEGIEKSFDGDLTTIYHSSWKGTEFPVTLTYNFTGKDSIDYIIYYPRTDGTNGNFIEAEIWTQNTTSDYVKAGEYNFEASSQPSVISLPERLKDPKSVKFVIKSGFGDPGTNGFASCAEMEFYKKDGKSSVPDIFTDRTCSQLKASISQDDIQNIEEPNYRKLADALYTGKYPSEYRIRFYEAYPDPAKIAQQNRIGRTYSQMDNPTGIFVERDENIVVFVGDMHNQRISLRALNLDKDYACTDYLLKEGLNVLKAKDKGLLYIMYNSSDPQAQPVKIHIASGAINGYFDITKNTNKDWKPMLDSAVSKYIDVVGKYVHLTFGVDDFKRYTNDVESLIQTYDSIVWLEQKFMGWEKYNRMSKNRMYFYLSNSKYFMFATTNRTGYSKGSMRDICNPGKLKTTAIWGPAHEVGHVNQTIGFKWVGLTEVSNNVYSMYVQQQFGNPSRLATEKLHSDFDGIWFNRYEKGFTEMLAGGVSQMRHGDVFCKLIPFWQLQLYNADVKGNKDFYADVHEQIRLNPIPETDGEAQVQFMKICCDAAKTDFTDFFIKWGMLLPIGETLTDHSSIQNQVYSRKSFTITQQQVDDLIKYAQKYKKPEDNVHYIHDTSEECVKAFIREANIKEGEIIKNNKNVDMTGWENVIVFEVYDGDKLVFVTPSSSFQLPENIKEPIIYAVPAKGKPVIKKL